MGRIVAKNIAIKVFDGSIVRIVLFMISMSGSPVSKLAQLRRRRASSASRSISVDINADFEGRRRTGDPRLDLAGVDRL